MQYNDNNDNQKVILIDASRALAPIDKFAMVKINYNNSD